MNSQVAHLVGDRDGGRASTPRSHPYPFPLPRITTAAKKPLTVEEADSFTSSQAGIQRPKTRHSPLDSRLRGNDGNREVVEPKCDCPASRGGGNWIRRALRCYRQRYSSTNSRYLCVSVVHALLGHQLVFHQVFGDLNGVEGRTLAKIIGDDPHRKSVLNGRILPQAADEDRILAGAFDGGH